MSAYWWCSPPPHGGCCARQVSRVGELGHRGTHDVQRASRGLRLVDLGLRCLDLLNESDPTAAEQLGLV